MNVTDLLAIIQAVSVILAICVAFGTIRSRQKGETVAFTELRVDVKYIKEKVSEIDSMDRRLIIVEQSAESAHKRLDNMEYGKERTR